ncbi:hypothetical protein D1646_03855 [Pseudoflavonifractor sp. 60]|uniref:hypothetical protein n=1 Tax=Pseudoflavonifractor sp. 60 TaxID=2304576 RepID=UPI001370300F|nr:hypothetical protein [Pseudoflavonifractor sp. 60]NBI65957.1 hypothetical protein [Pseudoflavonifractor sp. 60]
MEKFNFDYLLRLPGSPQEQAWIKERLETLSVRESCVLAAAAMRASPQTASEAADQLCTLSRYMVRFPIGSYEQLGEWYLRDACQHADELLPYVDLQKMGELYEEEHPGLFIGNCYVEYPTQPISPRQETDLPRQDSTWSFKLKLASPTVPEGVWLRLPDLSGQTFEKSVELRMVLNELQVQRLDDCTLLESQCFFPQLEDLAWQYESVEQLVRDGDTLGCIMDELGGGDMEDFAAALDYENCHNLRFAMDIIQNTQCYNYIPRKMLKNHAETHLRAKSISETLIQSGCIDLERYAEDLLEAFGYVQISGDVGYLRRTNQQFVYDHSPPPPEQSGMTMQ